MDLPTPFDEAASKSETETSSAELHANLAEAGADHNAKQQLGFVPVPAMCDVACLWSAEKPSNVNVANQVVEDATKANRFCSLDLEWQSQGSVSKALLMKTG